MGCPVCCLMLPRTACLGTTSPTVGGPSSSIINQNTLAYQSHGGVFSIKIPSAQLCLGLYQADRKQPAQRVAHSAVLQLVFSFVFQTGYHHIAHIGNSLEAKCRLTLYAFSLEGRMK